MLHTVGDKVDIVELQVLKVLREPLGVWGIEEAAEAELGIPYFLARLRFNARPRMRYTATCRLFQHCCSGLGWFDLWYGAVIRSRLQVNYYQQERLLNHHQPWKDRL
jgi:hypothetical protein